MAAVAPPADQAADFLQKLSLDSNSKTVEIPDATKKLSVDSTNMANGVQSDRSVTPVSVDNMDPTTGHLQNGYPSQYYYGGYDASGIEWEDYSRYMNSDGVETNPGAYGENGSLMYHPAYSYAPYGPYSPATSPVPTLGHDGQMYSAQHYQYPSPYFQSLTHTSSPYPTTAAPAKGDLASDQTSLSVDSTNSKLSGVANWGGAKGSTGRVAYHGSYARGPVPGGVPTYQDPRFGYDSLQSSMPWFENPYYTDAHSRTLTGSQLTSSFANGNVIPSSRNQNYQPHLMGLHHPKPMPGMTTANGYMNRMYPNKLYGQYGNSYRSGMGYGSNGYNSRTNVNGWMSIDSKYKPRGRGNGLYGYGNENMDGLNELNRGPRAKSSKNQKGFVPVALAVKGQNIPFTVTNDDEKLKSSSPDREQYNQPDMPVSYPDAKFFIIKSYSEDDVHKSIKYNVWSSTPNGNKKLDDAYSNAQQKSGGCPIFLFFSVNTSGQFVGVAEMTGPVDFNKNVEYWQQDKWVGCFPVKWHIVKDTPNSMLKHIILENNENKPVTNSRDTQEVKLDQGLEVLKIFKDHISKQCILDDFEFYEDRQKRIQEKKAKQLQYQKQAQQAFEGKTNEENNKDGKEETGGDIKPQKSLEGAPDLNKETTEKSSLLQSGDVSKTLKPAADAEKQLINCIANGC